MEQRALFAAEVLRPTPNPGALTVLREAALVCGGCELSRNRTNVVFGNGNSLNPLVTFVGEAPGATEDRVGKPFVGKAGELLNRMIEAMNLSRSDIYIANTVCCRPPQNRKPEPPELLACSRFLFGQLRATRPHVIVALGLTAAQALLKTKKMLGELRGKWHEWESTPLRVTYHPAFLLRVPQEKAAAWIDLQEVSKKLDSEVLNASG
jgi:uracil-DNA glycosylase